MDEIEFYGNYVLIRFNKYIYVLTYRTFMNRPNDFKRFDLELDWNKYDKLSMNEE